MPFNIQAFNSVISRHSVSRSDMFEMTIHIPPKVGERYRERTGLSYVPRDMTLRVDSTELPQRSITAVGLQDYGVPYKMGGTPNYVDITATIILSDDLRERELFLGWQDVITGDHRSQARARKRGDGLQALRDQGLLDARPEDGGSFSTPQKNAFDVGYYDDYKSDGIVIHKYNSVGLETHRVRLIEAFPLIVSGVAQSWSQVDIEKQSITIAYRYFTDEFLGNPIARVRRAIDGDGNLLDNIDADTVVGSIRDRVL